MEGSLDAGDYFISRIDLAGITTDATEADLEVFAQIFKHSHVAGSRGGEFHGKMVHLQPVELAKNGSVTSGVSGFAPGAGSSATAEVNRKLDILKAFDDLVDHIDTEVRGMFGVVISSADIGIDEQAKVRVVNLNNGNAFFAQQFNFAAKDGDAVGDERLARGVGATRFFGGPHAFTEQRGSGQGCLDLTVGDRFQIANLGGNETGVLGCELVDYDGPRAAVSRIGAQFEAVGQFSDDTDVGGAPPFAIGENIYTGILLQSDCFTNGSVKLVAGTGLTKQCPDGIGARQGADDGGGK